MPSPLNGLTMPPASPTSSSPSRVVRLAVEAHRQRRPADRAGHVLVAVAPLLGRVVEPAPRAGPCSRRCWKALLVLRMPEADVGRAVADAEDPAVAGQQPAPARCRPTAPATTRASRRRGAGWCSSVRTATPIGRSSRGRRPIASDSRRGVAVGGDHERGAVGGLGARAAVASVERAVTPRTRPVRSSSDRAGDRGALVQPGARPSARVRARISSKSRRRADQAVATGSRRGRARASSRRWPPPMMRRPLLRIQPASGEMSMPMATSDLHRPRGQAVAADLLARERRLLQQQDVEARPARGGTRSSPRPVRRRRR